MPFSILCVSVSLCKMYACMYIVYMHVCVITRVHVIGASLGEPHMISIYYKCARGEAVNCVIVVVCCLAIVVGGYSICHGSCKTVAVLTWIVSVLATNVVVFCTTHTRVAVHVLM